MKVLADERASITFTLMDLDDLVRGIYEHTEADSQWLVSLRKIY